MSNLMQAVLLVSFSILLAGFIVAWVGFTAYKNSKIITALSCIMGFIALVFMVYLKLEAK